MANFSRTDLNFLLEQIFIAEDDSAAQQNGNFGALPGLVGDPTLSFGLRNVNGTYNNLVPGQSLFGSADRVFPRLLTPEFIAGETVPIGFGSPSQPEGSSTSYNQKNGVVFDSQPRLVSNLIVDQTPNNPAAVAAAGDTNGSELVTGQRMDGASFDTWFIPNVTPDEGLSAPYNSWFTLFGQFFDHGLDLVNKGQSGTVFVPLPSDDPLIAGPDGVVGDDPNTFIDESLDDSPGANLAVFGDDPTTTVDESGDDSSGAEAFFGDDPNTVIDESLDDEPGPDGILGDDPNTVGIDEGADDTPGPDGVLRDDPNTFIDESLDDTPGTLQAAFGDNPHTALDESADDSPGADGVLGDDPNTFIDESLDDLPADQRFMVMTRATNLPGPDGQMGTGDDVHNHMNQTTPFIDQNQTYTSHPSHQAFLREYVLNAGDPVSTGKLLEGAGNLGGLATWKDIKLQAQTKLGFNLTDADLNNLPLLATDTYGQLILSNNGFAQLVLSNNTLLAGNPNAPVNIPGNVVRTGHAFLDDIAHTAAPRGSNGAMKQADGDNVINQGPAAQGEYDDELLDAHFITGDGRGNENIGLTTVHTVFHAEHNTKVDEIKTLITNSGDNAFINQWKLPDGSWNGERLFQAAKFATEMQYQHLVFEEFARKVQPNVDVFVDYDSSIDPAIMAEFAHVVYRFGHSMLTETVERTNANGSTNDIGLIQAFLNPVEFAADYNNNLEGAAAVVRGMTGQVGNEIDEFVTEALRNNLVGLPLDLAAINLARGRDTGIPSLNDARRLFHDDSGLSAVQPYESWADFGASLRHPESLTNFIAAYGNHPSINNAITMEDKRAAAEALINNDGDFMNSTNGFTTANTGLDSVDFWIGGLAEAQAPFGGLLGSTFNFVFETQLENLQNGDRFYYLARTAGLDFLTQLEENSFAEMIMRNLPNVKHLPFDVFSTPTYTFEAANLLVNPTGIFNDQSTPYNESSLLVRDTSLGANTIRYNGAEHIVMGGTEGVDRLRAGNGDDTIWGDGGNDRLEGGGGNDSLNGGDGNDRITDSTGDDNIKGGDGHDFINGGAGINLILAGEGHDFVVTGNDSSEVFAGPGNDFIYGNTANAAMIGNDGHDWIQNGTAGGAIGDNNDPFNSAIIRGNDVFVGGGGGDDFTGEGGDDIMNGLAGVDRMDGDVGFDWVVSDGFNAPANIDLDRLIIEAELPGADLTVDRFKFVEAASGWNLDDIVVGDDTTSLELTLVDPGSGQNNALDNTNNPASGGHSATDRIAQINGLSALLGGATTFDSGNILLGGGGSDRLEGRGGDDIIDGDAWLNTRIVANGTTSFDNMTSALRTAMQNGTYSPDQLAIVREILTTNSGTDTAVYRDVFANYVVTVSSSTGTIFVDHANVGAGIIDEGTDTVRNVERLQFADRTAFFGTVGDDNLVGTAANDVIFGLAGNDTLDGAGGNDVLVGGTGNDTYIVDTTTDTLTELAGGGTDTILSSVTRTLAATFENLTLTGANAINGTGNAVDNVLIGNSNNNILIALVGNDTLTGGDGNDTLDGGTGVDTMTGGLGDDIYFVGATTDVINELANEGIDTLNSSVTRNLNGTQLENITLTGAGNINSVGNASNNVMIGNTGNNIFDGNTGNDTLNGGNGNDSLTGAAGADTLTGGAGVDTFIYGAAAQSIGVNQDTITDFVSGTDRINLNGIDANINNPGNDNFTFIGNAAFTAPAQVRYDAGTGLLQANVNGTFAPELQIQLTGNPVLVAGDIIL